MASQQSASAAPLADHAWDRHGLWRVALVLCALVAFVLLVLALVVAPVPLLLTGHAVMAAVWAGAVFLCVAALSMAIRAIDRRDAQDD